MKVFFIGAGPGDPKLITLKAKEILEKADIVIYAGSLVKPEILEYAKESAKLIDSKVLNLKEINQIYEKTKKESLTVARVHSGDTSIYSAVAEQMNFLDEKGIDYEVIPGVSSFQAAAAALRVELTLPEISQTVILTRLPGRTPVPQSESLQELAKLKATMCIFLSVGKIDEVVSELLNGYEKDTCAAVIYKISQKDEKIIRGNLSNIAEKVKNANIDRTALIMVGKALSRKKTEFKSSKLYDENFSHSFR